jgi:hypothetical protein
MTQLYQWHTPFVVAFLAFVVAFALLNWRRP